MLFDSEFLARLEQLELLSRKTFVGRTAGQRRSLKKGHGVEFVDYLTGKQFAAQKLCKIELPPE